MKKAKSWWGYILVVAIIVLAVVQFLNNNAHRPEDDPAGQMDVLPVDQGRDEQGGAVSGDKPDPTKPAPEDPAPVDPAKAITESGKYTTKEDVALYIHLYGHLPDNFMTKREAEKLGWTGGSLERFAPGKCIGGDRFGNYEGKLPKAPGRSYLECDIDTLGAKSRGAKRIVFSNDGLIYYTDDHYNTFTLLYGEVSG